MIVTSPERASKIAQVARMPVVFDTRVVTGSGGGPDKTILNSPRHLEPLGYRMLCGYLHPPGDDGYREIIRKAERHRAPLVSIPDRGPLDWRAVKALLDTCRRERVDIWHGHDYKSNALGLLLKRFHPMKLVTTVHGWVHHTARTPMYYRVDKFCLPRYEKVICVSDDLYDACRRIGVPARRCELIENAIDLDDYSRSLAPDQAKAKLGLPLTGFLVGAVGRLEPEKGFDILVRAMAELVRRDEDISLLIVGEGGDRPRLEALAAELGVGPRLRLVGWQSDVRDYFQAMDLFALSSFREGLPNVLLEAMALQVPSVATRINGVPKLVQDGRNGLLVPPGDPTSLANALQALIANADLRHVFRHAGRKTVETRHSFPVRMRKLKEIYDAVLNRSEASAL
jgi:glycosyltransferase involved in cell wall biosynthesis